MIVHDSSYRHSGWLLSGLVAILTVACVDPEDLLLRGTNDILVVDGTITNLAEPQVIKLNRSQADPLTGRFGTIPVTKATVTVVVDSAQFIACHETLDGSYQLPSDFKGRIGHAYQLQFTLSDGTIYHSDQQVMPDVPPIATVRAQFNPKSLSPALGGFFTAGHDITVDWHDPIGQHNYYRWDWTLYERQIWCRTCYQGVYAVHKVIPHRYLYNYYFVAGDELYEDCFIPPTYNPDNDAPYVPGGYWYNDYNCRTQCWEILHNYAINLFDDVYSNGGFITQRKVAAIPFYRRAPCLVDIRQMSMTKEAYHYYKLFQDQTQSTGSLVDTPPTVLGGNVHDVTDAQKRVVGYFTASGVSLYHQWINRKDTEGIPFGATDPEGPHENEGDDLFYALNLRRPFPEPPPPYQGDRYPPNVRIWPNTDRPPTAPCLQSDNRTPYKPEGWLD